MGLFVIAALVSAVAGSGAPPPAAQQNYDVVPVAPDERSGRSRQIRCRVGDMAETTCTFTPLFGDGSFQLDGPGVAVRMIIDDGTGYLFEVFGPDRRTAVGGAYIRNPRDRACWVATDGGPSPVCAR
jgi:hypothetical protein